ncbi:MAG: restriction endonuclease subunit S [Kiritimatiellales bacterium]
MKLETFFEKFDQFADAPDAGAKMRELVLELAVQGRLASALPSDGTVPSVIEFRENAAALANSLGLRSPKESVEEVEQPFDVPSHWRWMELAEIGAAQTGTTPSKTDHDAFNGDIPFIKPADILPNSINYSNESLTRHGAERGSRLAPSGSLLMVCIGTIGKCNLIERECAFNQQINSLTPVASVDSRYLLIAARSRFFQAAAWKKSSSTTLAILNKGKWLSIPVPLPPLAEQKRIVAKVEEMMALCDRLETQQKEREEKKAVLTRASLSRFADAPTPANLNFLFHSSFNIHPSSLRQSILTLAVQGKLLPQDPNDEPAATVVKNINVDKARLADEKLISRRKPIDPPDPLELPFTVPAGWHWSQLEDLVYSVGDGPHFSPKYVSAGDGVPFLSTRNIAVNGFQLGDIKYVSQSDHEEFCRKVKATEGDILYTKGGTTGIALVNNLNFDFSVWVHLAVLKVAKDHLLSQYVALALNSPHCYEQSQRHTHGIGNRDLGLTRMVRITVPLPPLAEQRRIVAKVEQLMALVDELETQLAASRAAAANLLSALVAELTGTPNDRKISAQPSKGTGRRGRPPKS